MIVVDTHMLLWYAAGDDRLPVAIRRRMEEAPGEVRVPTICIWEALVLAARGRIEVRGENPGATVRGWIRRAGFQEAPLTGEIAVLSRTLQFGHDDPADRFIAATAHALDAELATVDERLLGLPWLRTVG